jgi:hypothetical protein
MFGSTGLQAVLLQTTLKMKCLISEDQDEEY